MVWTVKHCNFALLHNSTWADSVAKPARQFSHAMLILKHHDSFL